MYADLRWKGKLVSRSIYERNMKLSTIGKKNKKSVPVIMTNQHSLKSSVGQTRTDEESIIQNAFSRKISDGESTCYEELCELEDCNEDPIPEKNPVKGRRIVDLSLLAKRMICNFCRKDLLLRKIEHETRRGFASILHIRCEECLRLNKVPTGNEHLSNESRRMIFDVNTKIVLGALQNGLGYAHINKLMSAIDVPVMAATAFRRREKEICSVVGEIVPFGCEKGERNLNTANGNSLPKMLPSNLRAELIFRTTLDRHNNSIQRVLNEAMEATNVERTEQKTKFTTAQSTSVKLMNEADTESPATDFFKRLQMAEMNKIEIDSVSSDILIKSEDISYDMG